MALTPDADQFSQFLRLAFLRSPNFLAGVSGWTINQDGSAEFNNLTIRGTFNGTDFILNSKGLFFYSGTPANGNLIGSVGVSIGGTDQFGNTYVAGNSSYANTAGTPTTEVIGGQIALGSAAQIAGTSGQAAAFIFPSVSLAGLSLQSALQSAADNVALLQLLSRLAGGLGLPLAKLNGIIDLQNSASTPTQDTGNGALIWADANGYPRAMPGASGDTTAYQATGRASKIATSTPQTVNSTTGQAVTGITFPVAVGTYELDALLFCTAGPNNVLSAAAVQGPTTSFASFLIEGWDTTHASTVDALGAGNQTSMGALTNYVNAGAGVVTNTHTFAVKIRGRFTTTAAGTITLLVNTTVAANTYTINNGSYATLMPSA